MPVRRGVQKRARRNLSAVAQREHPLAWRTAMLAELGESLRNPGFFSSLPHISEDICRYNFRGVPVAIKDTGGSEVHGYHYTQLRRSFLAHQLAVRDGTIKAGSYKLRSIKVLGVIGGFLIMRYVKGTSLYSTAISQSLTAAHNQMQENFQILRDRKIIERIPQVYDAIIAGNTNPKQPEKGKWVFYLPYDWG